MKKIILAGLSLFIISTNSFANLLIEPFVGTGTSKLAFTNSMLASAENSSSISTYGARLGYKGSMLLVGIDHRSSTIGSDRDTFEKDFSLSATSAFIGLHFSMFRVWGGVALSSSFDAKPLTTKSKGGTLFGFGFTGLPLVSINYEMMTNNIEFDLAELGLTAAEKATVTTSLLSLSIPFDL